MNENIFNIDFWLSLRKRTRVNGTVGRSNCKDWCHDALRDPDVARTFTEQIAELGDIQIDQIATSVLVHHWLEALKGSTTFAADGTAGQYDTNYPDGYYGPVDEAPPVLRDVYSKKV